MEKVILITGTSKGLGKLMTNTFSNDHKIYAGTSSKKAIRQSPIKNVHRIYLDLTKEETIVQAVNTILSQEGKIDTIIHNSGISISGGVDALSMEEVRKLFDINFFGALKLNQLILPHMRERKSGQLIFISSIRGVESHGYFGVYSASKASLEAVALDWAITLSKWNIKVSIVQPGPILTGCEIFEGTYFKNKNPYPTIPPRHFDWEKPEDVVEVIEEILNSKHPSFAYQTASSSKKIIEKHLNDPCREMWIREQKMWFENKKTQV